MIFDGADTNTDWHIKYQGYGSTTYASGNGKHIFATSTEKNNITGNRGGNFVVDTSSNVTIDKNGITVSYGSPWTWGGWPSGASSSMIQLNGSGDNTTNVQLHSRNNGNLYVTNGNGGASGIECNNIQCNSITIGSTTINETQLKGLLGLLNGTQNLKIFWKGIRVGYSNFNRNGYKGVIGTSGIDTDLETDPFTISTY
jgi:hypothetical protein